MSDESVPDHIAQSADVPAGESDLARAREMGEKLLDIQQDIAAKKKELSDLEKSETELRTKTLPEFMDRIRTDHVGVPERDVDIVVSSKYHASIASSWPDEKREEAFSYLESLDMGDLIGVEVVLVFNLS